VGAPVEYQSGNKTDGERLQPVTMVVSLLGGFVGGFVAWFCSNYLGRPLVKLLELRSETHTFLYYYANIKFDRPPHYRNVEDAQKCFRWLGSRLDALRTSSLRPVLFLFCLFKYNLEGAANGLTGLSNALAPDREGEATDFRVQAQRALRLPVDPEDQKMVDTRQRLKGVRL
jgi:hypothetical protein